VTTKFVYQVEVKQGEHLIITNEGLIKQLKNTELGRPSIEDVQRVSSVV
jgi:hypothetical protein